MVSAKDPLDNNSTPEENEKTDRLRHGIEQTRAEMDETIDALGTRLQPKHLLDEAMGYMGIGGSAHGAAERLKAAGAQASDAVWKQIKAHPLPAAAAGAGVAWLIYALMKGEQRKDFIPTGAGTYGGSYVDARTGQSYDKQTYGADAEIDLTCEIETDNFNKESEEGAKSTMSHMKQKARHAKENVQGTAAHVKDMAQGAGRSVRQGASFAGEKIQAGVESGREKVQQYPLAAGAAALGVGIMVGLLLPSTRRENSVMGSAAGAVRGKALEAGEEILERGKAAAATGVESIRQAAEREGLTPHAVGEKIKTLATDATNAASEAMAPAANA